MNLNYLFLPLVAALIGWITNWIAVKMLFHPRRPQKILFLFTIHGVFPKRQKAFAESLGRIVSAELFSVSEVTDHIRRAATSEESMDLIVSRISAILSERLPQIVPMLAMIVNPEMIRSMIAPLSSELKKIIEELSSRISSAIEADLDVKKLVSERVMNFSVEKLEDIINGIMKRELREVEILGGVLGFLIGCGQVLISNYIS